MTHQPGQTTASSQQWPDGVRSTVSVTFDNLGGAAEEELGLPTPTGSHFSVTTALPIVLDELAVAGLRATFFVEGVNAESYPDAVRSIVDAGHECAYHAWHHEDWSQLTELEELDNLSRGLAFGVNLAGFRPPGGRLNGHTVEALREREFSHSSPAGAGAGIEGIVLLPFAWSSVDAYDLLPQFAALRSHIDGSDEPGGPERVAEAMIAMVDQTIATGAYAALLFHPMLIDTERDALRAVLAHVRAAAQRGEVWVARCDEVAAWIERHPDSFTAPAQLDTTSWLNP
jgi:peptidoglycan/xylan/chitin deacetylase (PgdA/CDA1 family)